MKIDKKVLRLVGLVSGFVVLVTLFLTLAQVKDVSSISYSGLDLILGSKDKDLLIEYGIKPNILVILGYLATIAAVVMLAMNHNNPLITLILFGAAAVLFIVGPATIKVFVNDNVNEGSLQITAFAYLASGLNLLGAAASLLDFLVPDKKGKRRK